MDDNNEQSWNNRPNAEPDSPKPLSFTIDFSNGKVVDTERHKCLVEKYQKRHTRGKSLSKLELKSAPVVTKKRPLTGNLPRKSSFQSDGYYSSDEKCDYGKNSTNSLHSEMSLPLKAHMTDKMAQSFPSCNLPSILSPEIELKDISSPELDSVSPYSPNELMSNLKLKNTAKAQSLSRENNTYEGGTEFDVDKSDTVSDAGTYTLDADNYTEEQKARMSIDEEFKIEHISLQKKTEDYIRSLTNDANEAHAKVSRKMQSLNLSEKKSESAELKSPQKFNNKPVLSPILSPTQNLSILQNATSQSVNNGASEPPGKNFTKIMFPRRQSSSDTTAEEPDLGTVISVTSSGAFRTKNERERKQMLNVNLTKSEVHVVTYLDDKSPSKSPSQSQNVTTRNEISPDYEKDICNSSKLVSLPPAVGGVSSKVTTKIPSPIHSLSRPRSRSSCNSYNVDLSDSSLETESYLKPTQNYINSLQKRLSFDSDQESDSANNYTMTLNNDTRNIIKQKLTHVRHNSFDDRNLKSSNKLEHFQNKNLQGIDQTFSNVLNQYSKKKAVRNVQNSPNSPIRRSSSFSTKNQINLQKNLNDIHKEINVRKSPNLNINGSIQRSASTTSIKPYLLQNTHRTSDNFDRYKIDRNQFGDTESSSDEEFEKTLTKKKDFSNITNTRYNRAFSLRRARLDAEPPLQLKCPNTPEMRRKFQPDRSRAVERAISVDRKPAVPANTAKASEVQSRYLLNINKNKITPPSKSEAPKIISKPAAGKPQVFSRTDSGRFSTRSSSKPPIVNASKNTKKDSSKKSGGRSNSSLSSREVEFQNWKRRKSYDPMKAAAEGKKKAEIAKRQNLNVPHQETNQNQDCDSSPSHSSSVHRSQSFHGTAALEKLISSEEDDLTFSADEGFSPPTPSPCELSPARANLRQAWHKRLKH